MYVLRKEDLDERLIDCNKEYVARLNRKLLTRSSYPARSVT